MTTHRSEDSKTDRLSDGLSRRRYLAAGGAGLAASLAGCVSGLTDSGSDSTELVVAGAGGSWGEFEREIFFDPWAEETGNAVSKQNMQGLKIAQQIQANEGDPEIHMGGMANIRGMELGQRELLLSPGDHLDGVDQLPEAAVSEYFASYIFTPWGIGYNADAVDLDVTEWSDLLDPAFEGKIAFPAWGWMGSLWVYGLDAALGGGDVADVSRALSFVERLVEEQNAVVMEDTDHGLRLFQNEEIVIAPYWNARTDQIELETDVSTEFVIPSGGSIGRTYGFAMVDGHSDEETEAIASLGESVLDPEAQAEFATETGYPPTHPDAEQHIDDKVLDERPTIRLTDEERANLAKTDVDWAAVPEYRDGHAEEWRKIVRG